MIRYAVFIAIFLSTLPTFAQQKTEPTTPIVPNDSVKQEWIDRYLSVAYPLSKIVITSRYGYRRDPFTGKRTLHGGVDLLAKYEPVYAMLFGKIAAVGDEPRGGKYVTIKHGDFMVTYRHLSKISTRKGTIVKAGDTVAISGNSGSRSTGPHLHIETTYKGQRINPTIFLNFVQRTHASTIANLPALE
jgi:murein DD-endopeptidase